MTMIDTDKVRNDTPGCRDKLFMNSAGASLVPTCVTQAMKHYLDIEAMHGGYQTAPMFQSAIDLFYNETAMLLNTNPSNIAFTYNATDGFGKALASIPFKENDLILTSDDDYISNFLTFMSLQQRIGIRIERIKTLENGDIDIIDAEHKIRSLNPKLVSITHVPTNSGKIQAIKSIGQFCHKYDILYIVDACQSVGQMPIDVMEIKCDFLSATGRKFLRGPRGTGFLYVSDKILSLGFHPLALDMRGGIWTTETEFTLVHDAKRYELWETSLAGVVGLGAAIKYLNQIGAHHIQSYNDALCKKLKMHLSAIDDLTLTENGSMSASIVTFTSKTRTLEQLKATLDEAKIYYSVGWRHFALIDFNKKDVDWVIRLSPHYFNTFGEIDEVGFVLR